jgi:CcmD family protein
MYSFLEHNALYVVLLIVLIVWAGLFVYLFRIDGKVRKLDRAREDAT